MTSLVVSAEFVRPGLVGGTEQALHYTLDGLSAALRAGDRLQVVGDVMLGAFPSLELVRPPIGVRNRFIQESLSFARIARRADSYYLPNYFTPPLPGGGCRVVTTIPDLQYQHLPENFSARKRRWLRAAHELTLRRADTVTVYSEFVREDLLDRYGGRHEERLTVLPIPVSWERFGTDGGHIRTRPYVLSVASHYAHKNLPTLVRAFGRLAPKWPDLDLVLVGQLSDRLIGVRRADDVRSLVAELGLDDRVVVTGYIGVSEVGQLYRNALAFAFPSTFEGFGLPPVEALGFGLPVVTTRCTSLPEVTLDAARYVADPMDHEELAEQLLDVLVSGWRPKQDRVDAIRARYDPVRVGRELYDIMTSGGA